MKTAIIENALKNLTDNDQCSAIDCKSLEKFVVEFLDDQLPAQTRTAFLKHIKECEHCDEYLQSYRKTINLSKAALTDNISAEKSEIPEKLVEAILAASRKP